MRPRASPSAEDSVLAVVVTFNPEDGLLANLRSLAGQVEVVIVDNHSANRGDVAAAARATGSRLVQNDRNLGIAAALNQAAAIARTEGYGWLATFDQDSLIAGGAIESVLAAHARLPDPARVAVMAMTRRDRSTGLDYTAPWSVIEEHADWRLVRTTITSGNLVRVTALEAVGGFDEGLFIDSVDHDFCLRCRARGFLVVEDKTTVMDHSVGAVTRHRLLGRTVATTNQSPTRQYYITRNVLEVVRRSLAIDRAWAWRGGLHLIFGVVKVALFERERGAKSLAMIEGARDFLLRRFGPRGGRIPT